MTIKPTRTNIAVSIDKELVKTKSGIIISNEANEEAPTRGKVIAIGDSKDISKNIKIGSTVVFPPYTGISIVVGEYGEEEEVLLMDSETAVFAVLE